MGTGFPSASRAPRWQAEDQNPMTAQTRGDFAGGLILALRGAVLVIAGAALWHWPVGSAIVSAFLAVLAVLVFVVAGLAFLVASAAWRNAAVRVLSDRMRAKSGQAQKRLALPFLAALAALSVGLFLMVGRIFA